MRTPPSHSGNTRPELVRGRPAPAAGQPRVGYVLKAYPRLSETFILNEILAHEAAGAPVDIFSLRPPNDGLFHPAVARVRSRVTYVPRPRRTASTFWEEIGNGVRELPHVWPMLQQAGAESSGDLEQAIHLARVVRRRGIEHLHAHFGTVSTTVARLAAGMAGIPYSFTAHAKDIYHSSVQHDDLRRKLADAGAVVTVSKFNVKHLKTAFGPAAGGVRLVHNGLDLSDFELCDGPRNRVILGVGRLVEKKGFSLLVDACALLKGSGVSFHCEIIGAGPLYDALDAQISSLGVGDCVELVGPLPQDELRTRIRAAGVLAAPCLVAQDGDRDGLPTVLLEAMALGTPCVSTDVTGIPEVLLHGTTGLAVPQENPAALAVACRRLLDDEVFGQHLARHARRVIESDFDIHKNSARLRQIFSGLVPVDSGVRKDRGHTGEFPTPPRRIAQGM